MMKRLILFLMPIVWACEQEKLDVDKKIFDTVHPAQSGVDFANMLSVSDSMNYFQYGYFYMGGGVAAGDLNGDELVDLYFTGNMVSNELYLNLGDLKFNKITEVAGVGGDNRWVTGCALHDINADGLLDIYVSVAGKHGSTENLLYVNQGNNEKNIPIFKEMAQSYGLADIGNTIQATFLDYDGDGLVDVYVANYRVTPFNSNSRDYVRIGNELEHKDSDHLYRNNGDNTFTDVTKEAGVFGFGLAIGVIASDFNNDGWTDIYVSNDFNTPDFLYLNNQNGTFIEVSKETTQHTSFYGMGVDAGDINGDGLMDIMQVDMSAADNYRSKANMSGMDIAAFWNNQKAGFHYQYMYNSLQVNNGIRENGNPFFSDVAKMSGMHKTDWSWAALFADYDNDGLKDLYITNGTRRDINNKDYFRWLDRTDIRLKIDYKEISIEELVDKMPFQKIDNYIYKNKGKNIFDKVNEDWGLKFEGFSNGAAYADLDNDGDLELIINNVDSIALIFENYSREVLDNNYLQIDLKGPSQNPLGLNAKIELQTDEGTQFHDHTLVRGYQSSVEEKILFGLGINQNVNQLIVTWPDGKQNWLENVAVNQVIQVNYLNAKKSVVKANPEKRVFSLANDQLNLDINHSENDFDDYQREVLLPHKMSQFGPGLAVGDFNNDNLEDIYLGGALNGSGQLMVQRADGTFLKWKEETIQADSMQEDTYAAWMDIDNDGDLDLYVSSGGNEREINSEYYQDRLYINNGQGHFSKATMPEIAISSSVVKPFDFDNDGDLDLFVGGRQSPGRYPEPSSSFILRNETEGGSVKFSDVTEEIAPDLINLGMVSDALWTDINNDGAMDLLLVGEWMPITIFENENGKFSKSEMGSISNTTGWWNTIVQCDIDQDGDMDYIAGNLGLNYKYQANSEETFDIYARDYDQNGKLDVVLGYYQGGYQYPVRGRQCSSEQIPVIKKKFKNYDAFASASLSEIYTEELLENSTHYKATTFASSVILNLGEGAFKLQKLPYEAQISSINDIEILDYNNDGHLDLLCAGNLFGSEVETPRNDASYGLLLEGNSTGDFVSIPYSLSGLDVPYETKEIERIEIKGTNFFLFATNNGPLHAIELLDN